MSAEVFCVGQCLCGIASCVEYFDGSHTRVAVAADGTYTEGVGRVAHEVVERNHGIDSDDSRSGGTVSEGGNIAASVAGTKVDGGTLIVISNRGDDRLVAAYHVATLEGHKRTILIVSLASAEGAFGQRVVAVHRVGVLAVAVPSDGLVAGAVGSAELV